MAGFNRGAAILISIILGAVILPILGISGIFSLVIIGFLANYLTVRNQRNYKIGGIAGGILGFLIFIYGFFVSPEMPNVPSISGFDMIGLALSDIFTLILGFILLVFVSVIFGSIGAVIAEKFLKKRREISGKGKKMSKSPKSPKSFANKKPKRSLNRK